MRAVGLGTFDCFEKRSDGDVGCLIRVGAVSKTPCGPPPGYLRDFTGLHVYVGHSGISQSATPHEIRCIYLNFNPVGLGSTSIGNRAHGFQLRCLSE